MIKRAREEAEGDCGGGEEGKREEKRFLEELLVGSSPRHKVV